MSSLQINFSDFKHTYVIGNISGMTIPQMNTFLSSFKDSIIIYTGDLNLNGDYNNDLDKLESLEYKLSVRNNHLLLVRGNHDNPAYFKVKSQFKKDLSEVSDYIMLIPDYQIIHINWYDEDIHERLEHNILCVGGANTLDRTIHTNVFKDESVKKGKYDAQKFKDVDIVISHASPLMVYPEELTKNMKHFDSPVIEAYSMYDKHLKTDIYKSRHILKTLYDFMSENDIDVKQWIYGHYNKSNIMTYNNTEFISLTLQEIKKIY